jgi:hypothetical protein
MPRKKLEDTCTGKPQPKLSPLRLARSNAAWQAENNHTIGALAEVPPGYRRGMSGESIWAHYHAESDQG